MERLGDVSRVRIVVIEVAVLAVAGFGLVQKRLQSVIGNLKKERVKKKRNTKSNQQAFFNST